TVQIRVNPTDKDLFFGTVKKRLILRYPTLQDLTISSPQLFNLILKELLKDDYDMEKSKVINGNYRSDS
ncbi:MAG: hypothetical protein GTO02_18145, partial [Candidatus Dadabacteria bacterium]|nr:hypothetical protein [Candidatus Dadabacteria bacterium]